MRSDLEEIKLEALSLGISASKRINCPQCRKDRMDITRRKEGILYHCWRPDCSMRGCIGTLPSNLMDVPKREKKEFTPRPFVHETITITESFYLAHLRKYTMSLQEWKDAGVKRVDWEKSIVMPLWDRRGFGFGTTVKNFTNKKRKAIHYLETNVPILHYALSHNCARPHTAILVEDWISAQRIALLGYRSVCLLGTELTDDKVKDLKAAGVKHVAIALDPDAYAKSIKIADSYRLFFNSFKVIQTPADPKDMAPDILRELITNNI